MKTVRINGIVRFAGVIRRELSHGVEAQRLGELQEDVGAFVRRIEALLAEARCGESALPAPSRRAYLFLKDIDWEAIAPIADGQAPRHPPASIDYPNLSRFLDGTLNGLARAIASGQPTEPAFTSLCNTSRQIEDDIRKNGFAPETLTTGARSYRGWIAYLSDAAHFAAYVAAVKLATEEFEAASAGTHRVVRPLIAQFRPIKVLYRMRFGDNGARVWMLPPAIRFQREQFAAMAALAFDKSRNKRAISSALSGEACREVHWSVERLGGLADRSAGIYQHLGDAFERVCAEYFGGAMPRPVLTWSRHFPGRKLGHYDHATDTVMVSATLDRSNVPSCVIDFVIYHELLHKQFGISWNGSRQAIHTANFAREEKRFREYDRVQEALKRLFSEAGRC